MIAAGRRAPTSSWSTPGCRSSSCAGADPAGAAINDRRRPGVRPQAGGPRVALTPPDRPQGLAGTAPWTTRYDRAGRTGELPFSRNLQADRADSAPPGTPKWCQAAAPVHLAPAASTRRSRCAPPSRCTSPRRCSTPGVTLGCCSPRCTARRSCCAAGSPWRASPGWLNAGAPRCLRGARDAAVV
ncbi:hypothetical protein HBB16_16795 [Pseudonocardia sp. MCCB 268]|nr:hypothetical protein [Pseudonocardia cytotoxica]